MTVSVPLPQSHTVNEIVGTRNGASSGFWKAKTMGINGVGAYVLLRGKTRSTIIKLT